MTKYFFVAASEKFLTVEEPLDEILKERMRNYKENNKEIDFWLIKNPSFLQTTKFVDHKSKNPSPPAAVLSTDKKLKMVATSIRDRVKRKVKSMAANEDYIPEEGYDIARDEGRVKSSKDKKDGTTMTPSEEMKKTQKKNEGPSAYERVKEKYKGQIMDVKKEEVSIKGHSDWRQELDEKCWKGYEKKGMKTMFGKRYPNCVKKSKKKK